MVVPPPLMILAGKIAAGRNVIRGNVHRGVRTDRSVGAFSIAIPASPCVVRSPARLKFIIGAAYDGAAVGAFDQGTESAE